MTGKTALWAMLSVTLTCGSAAFAEEPVSGGGHGEHRHCERGWSCKRFCAWLTYRPLPVPKGYRFGPVFAKTSTPPYYTYFIALYGPRSPALGFPPAPAHHGGHHCAHGYPAGVYPNPPGLDIPIPEESLPVPGIRSDVPSPSLPEPETLPSESPIQEQEASEPAPFPPTSETTAPAGPVPSAATGDGAEGAGR